jgi:hypothetical protein
MTNTARLVNALGWVVGLLFGSIGILLLLCAFATPVTAANGDPCAPIVGVKEMFYRCADLDTSNIVDLRVGLSMPVTH